MKIKVFGAVLITAFLASQLSATEIVTTSYTAWTGTLTGASAEWDFAFSNPSYGTAAGYSMNVGTYGPISVTGPDGSGYVLNENPTYFDATTSQNRPTLESAGDGVGGMTFTTPAGGLTAFGLGLGMLGTAGPITITLSDGETFSALPSINGDEFLGFSSSTPITSFSLSAPNGSFIELTDFDAGVFNDPAPAGEVTTAIMVATGLLFLSRWRK
jgi:hypothetical protein